MKAILPGDMVLNVLCLVTCIECQTSLFLEAGSMRAANLILSPVSLQLISTQHRTDLLC